MHDVVCSAHFVENIQSKNPNSPAYIPTLFPNTYKKISFNEMQQYDIIATELNKENAILSYYLL